MITKHLQPRFFDTDALGHINNAAYATWFEEGRRDFFKFFNPTLSPKTWNLIIVRVEIDYKAQGYYEKDATIETIVSKIGNSSFVLKQKCIQEGITLAEGLTTLVHFDYKDQVAKPIPEAVRNLLSEHLS